MIKAETIGLYTHNIFLNNIKKILNVIFKKFKLQKNKKAKNFNKKCFEITKYIINNKGHPLII